MSKKQPDPFQSIDLADLENVAGGAARASTGGSTEITAALTGVMDALSSLKNQSSSGGMDPMAMMMMMMMMGGGGGGAPQVVQQPAGTIGGYAGYTIDGVYYPFK